MPYITKLRRVDLSDGDRVKEAGELNYKFTLLAANYIADKGLTYQTINDIIGALEGAKLEFYARIARPYEDQKIKSNGDVY
jgi:hypothetical protein